MQVKKTQIAGKTVQIQLETDADKSVYEEILIDLDYKEIQEFIAKSNLPIIDIGAHIGVFAVYAGILNSHTKIFAYEPDERNFNLAKENIKKNRLKNIVIKNLAISDQAGEISFYKNQDSHNHSIYSKQKGEVSKVVVASRTLEQIAKADKYALLKLDAEGAEYPIILNSSASTLQKFQKIYIEYHDYQPGNSYKKLVQKLQALGFETNQKTSIYDSSLGFILATQS